MKSYKYGNPDSSNILIQMVDDHDMEVIENEVAEIKAASEDFCLIAIKVVDWNDDLSPWEAPAVFGNKDFAGLAEKTIGQVLDLCRDESKTYFIGGYSLAGLFALWAAYQTDVFKGVSAASPSIWFPGFIEFMKNNSIKSPRVYLSLGDKEEKTRNPVMATVGDCIRVAYDWLSSNGTDCVLKWNQGNHFKDADIRTAKAFKWILNTGK